LYLHHFNPEEIVVDAKVTVEMARLRALPFPLSYEDPLALDANTTAAHVTSSPPLIAYLNVARLFTKRANVVSEPLFGVAELVGLAECKLNAKDVKRVKTTWLRGLADRFDIYAKPGRSKNSGGMVVLARRAAGWHVSFSASYNIEVATARRGAQAVFYIYRPPSVPERHLLQLLREIRLTYENIALVIMGDLNKENLSELDAYADLRLHLQLPTRFGPGTASCLDCILSNVALAGSHVYPIPYSDHSAVWCQLDTPMRGGANTEDSSDCASHPAVRRRGKAKAIAVQRTPEQELAYTLKKKGQREKYVKKDLRTQEQKAADRKDAERLRLSRRKDNFRNPAPSCQATVPQHQFPDVPRDDVHPMTTAFLPWLSDAQQDPLPDFDGDDFMPAHRPDFSPTPNQVAEVGPFYMYMSGED
jgi:hypothetical protein